MLIFLPIVLYYPLNYIREKKHKFVAEKIRDFFLHLAKNFFVLMLYIRTKQNKLNLRKYKLQTCDKAGSICFEICIDLFCTLYVHKLLFNETISTLQKIFNDSNLRRYLCWLLENVTDSTFWLYGFSQVTLLYTGWQAISLDYWWS